MGKRRAMTTGTRQGKPFCDQCHLMIYGGHKQARGAASIARSKTGHDNIIEFKSSICGQWHIGHNRNVTKNRGERALADATPAAVPDTPPSRLSLLDQS